MKKAFLALAAAALLFCSACGSSAVPVEGTWYSVTDTTMYNFKDNEITVSGVTVGQYEDNGDSVVISMMDTGENMQLYVTTMENIDVLADVKEGEGNIYFCKGLENAKAFVEEQEILKLQSYIEENILGVWKCLDEGTGFEYIEFTDDHRILTRSGDAVGQQYWTNMAIGYGSDGRLCASITVADDMDGTNAWDLPLFPLETTYEQDRLYFGEVIMKKVEN